MPHTLGADTATKCRTTIIGLALALFKTSQTERGDPEPRLVKCLPRPLAVMRHRLDLSEVLGEPAISESELLRRRFVIYRRFCKAVRSDETVDRALSRRRRLGSQRA